MKCFLNHVRNVLTNTQNTFKMSSNKQTIDEFGRDLSLRKLTCGDYLASFKGLEHLKGIKSWVEISYLLDEEEEKALEEEKEAKEKAEAVMLALVLAERKKLLEKGHYELEEGEEVE
jgi:hypothetical protein